MKIKPNRISLAVILLIISCAINAQQTVTDIDGNNYKTIRIGNQVWMKENLKTTHYSNGDSIGTTWPATYYYMNESKPKYQWAYNGKDSLTNIYGRLYTWYAATDNRNICPTGWHLPSYSEWKTLIDYLGKGMVAHSKLKETDTIHWKSPNADATNESGFTGLPGGSHWDSVFLDMGTCGHYWSSSQEAAEWSYRTLLNFEAFDATYLLNSASPKIGWSVRCIEDPIADSAKYLNQTPPGNTAQIFAPGIVSNANSHCRLTISPDGKEIFWNVANFTTWESQIYCTVYSSGKWSDPFVPAFADTGITTNVVFSPEGYKLFFEYRDNTSSSWTIKHVEKTASGWSEPKSDGFLIDPSASFTMTGKVYYSDAMANTPWGNGIYTANYSDTGFSNIQPLPEAINPVNIINYTPYIAPDESYLLFASNRPMTGGNDANMYIYICFNNYGSWSTPQKINDAIKFSGHARLPSISPDGKYLFFCGDDNNFYWVDINAIEQLKPTAINNIPENGNISVFPNPNTGLINISFGNTVQKATIEIYNLQGALVFSNVLLNKSIETIDLTSNTDGIYIVKVIADGEYYEGKILKE